MGQELRDKIVASIKDFKNLSHPICYSEAANQANIEQFLLALFHTIVHISGDWEVQGNGVLDH